MIAKPGERTWTLPFALLALAGLRARPAASLEASLRFDRERAQEGESIAGELELRSGTESDRVEARLLLAPGLELEQEDARAFSLRAGEPRTLVLTIHARRWGAYSAGRLRVRVYDRLRLLADEQELGLPGSLRVYPQPEALRALARPFEMQAAVGDQVARAKGEGIELAELRPFSTGDDLRRVNWQASARLGELVVNDFHPERNTAVVLLLDAFAYIEAAGGAPLDECVRAAAALAERYLARRDRVGLLALGGRLRWLRPESGPWQRHRIVETLLESRALVWDVAGSAPTVPARVLPPGALVLALSPLLEDAVVNTLLELRGRGFDLAVVEIPPLRYLELEGAQAELAARLLALERELLRSRLRARGIAVVEWGNELSLEGAIRAMEEFRRRAHVVHA